MSKYKEGDTFTATLRIYDVGAANLNTYGLEVVGLEDEDTGCYVLEDYVAQEELDAAFDPNYKERQRLLKIQELEKELAELKGGENA